MPTTAGARLALAPGAALQIMRWPELDSWPRAATSGALLERIRCPEIVPLEVGDLLLDGVVIREQMIERGFLPALRRAITILHAGQGVTRSNGALPRDVEKFEVVFLAGGRIHVERLPEGLSDLPCPFVIGDGAYAGMQGGFDLLKMRGLSGWVLDLGQSQLKIATGLQFWTFPRDFCRLRSNGHVSPLEIPAQRRRLREFISLKLQLALAETRQRPQALVCALPARLAEDGRPGTGDYAGMKGDGEFLPDALALAGLSEIPLLVLNDAELAAFSARSDPRLAGFRKILVLTLGFGIGAALVCRSQ
jgi:hypothetical protein